MPGRFCDIIEQVIRTHRLQEGEVSQYHEDLSNKEEQE